MDAQKVHAVLVGDVHDPVEGTGVVKAQPHLDGEESRDRLAQRAQDAVDAVGVAEKPAADVLLVNLGSRAAEVQVESRHGMAGQLGHGFQQAGNVLADDLGEDRPAGVVLVDRAQDMALRAGLRVDPEEFREEVVGRPVAGDHPHEGQVGDVLHRRQRRRRPARLD